MFLPKMLVSETTLKEINISNISTVLKSVWCSFVLTKTKNMWHLFCHCVPVVIYYVDTVTKATSVFSKG